MSDEEKNASRNDADPPAIVVKEQTSSSHHKTPYRPIELKDDTGARLKRTTVLAMSSAVEQFKDVSEVSTMNETVENKDLKDSERAMISDKQKHNHDKKLTTSVKKHDPLPESIALTTTKTNIKKDSVLLPSQAIPKELQSATSKTLDVTAEKQAVKSTEDDNIPEEVAELRVPEMQHSEWSDEEEASGLPRSESRSSRVSRVVRQFFCCGVSYEAPSEYNISSRRRHYSHAI